MDRVDQLHVVVRRLRKDYRLMREEIEGSMGLLQNKLSSWGGSMGDKLGEVLDGQARKHKSKMEELLD